MNVTANERVDIQHEKHNEKLKESISRMQDRGKTGGEFRFRNFPVYQISREFRKDLKELSKNKFPKAEQFCLTSQLWRALDSILLNIAEGSERYSDVDFSRFLNTALTSLNEVVACLDAALDDNYISDGDHGSNLERAGNIYRQLKAFSARVRRDAVRN